MTTDYQQKQAEHFDGMAALYESHYSDRFSMMYRERFINAPLLEGIDLEGKKVLELMCGSGSITHFLLEKKAIVTGLDISGELINIFKRKWNCEAICASIFSSGISDDSYDFVVIVMGLHHLHPQVSEAIGEIRRVLKPGGYLCFCEPHSGSLPDVFRKIWYKTDKYFESNEGSLQLDVLKRTYADRFDFLKQRYIGGLAYLLVLNSMIFRIPLKAKKYIAPVLLSLEGVFAHFPTKLFSCAAINQWRKK